MDYLNYNKNQKISKINSYNKNNVIFNESQPNYAKKNPYAIYLIPESKNNIKTSFVQNNQFFHEITHKNNDFTIKENPKMIKFLTEYYSYPFKNINSKNPTKNKNATFKDNNNIKQKEFSLNKNPNSKYINYSPQKRYTFNYKEKNEIKSQDRIQPNSTQINIYNNNINNNTFLLNQNKKNKNSKENEKALLLNKLNSSKSTYNFCKEDIIIEYNNVPIIEQKQNRKTHINKNPIKENYYSFKNATLNKINAINNFSYENIDNNSIIENQNLKNISYINNKSNNDLGNIYFDADISNIEEKCDFININDNTNNDFFSNNRKWQFSRQKNDQNINMYNNYNLYNNTYLRDTKDNINSNNNIFDINDNNNNNDNLSKSKINEKIYKIKKANTELFQNKNKIKNNINKIVGSNKSIYLNNNEMEKNNNSSNIKRIKNYINKSKKDIFHNKEYTNIINLGNQKIKKRISPEPKNNIYANEYKINLDKSKTSKNSMNNNIIFHEINETKSIINKRNNNFQNNLYKYNLLTDQNINSTNFYGCKESKNNSYMNYEINEDNINNKIKVNNKITNNYPTKQKDKNLCFELKNNNTSRLDNSRLEMQNLILLSDNSTNKCLNTNIYGYNSSKNISYIKKPNNNISNQFSQKGKNNNSTGLNILQKMNCKKNNINIILDNNNFKDKKDNNINSKTEENIKYINRNEINKSFANNKNKILNENSFSILQNTNISKNINNMPVKLYLKKKDIIKNKDIIKQYNENKENNKAINNININNKIKQINNMYNAKMNININNNINIKKQNNNIINNNNTNSDILNNKKKTINICTEQRDNPDLNNKNKNINISHYYNKGINPIHKINDIQNLQTMKNELLEKNKNFKNIRFITSSINRNINNSNSNLLSLPSYIQMSANDITNINSKNIKIENNTKSDKNIFYTGNISEANRNIKNMILNNSSQYLFNYKNLEIDSDYINVRKPNKINSNFFRDFVISAKNNLNNNYENKSSFDNNQRNARNSNYSKDNITLYKQIKSPTLENNINLINFNEKIKIPLTPNLTQVHSKKTKVIKNNSGIYVKPFGIISKSKSKPKKVKKAKSVLKIFKNNNSERNTNKKRHMRNQSNLDYYFKTSPLFYQKDDYFQSEFGSIKRGSTSLNTSHITKYENSSSKTKENEISFENNSIIINYIREPYKKGYFFAYKLYKYYIKTPSIEQCFFSKYNIIKRNEIESFNEDDKNKTNNLRITFGNNNNNKQKNQFFIENQKDIINIEKNNYNDFEESDLDIYKELQKKMTNESEEMSNSNKLSYANKEEVIYKTIQKLKALNKNYNKNKISNSTKEKQITKENDKKIKKYTNLQNGIQILDNLALKKGLVKNYTNSNNNSINNENNIKKNEKISLIANKLNEIFNSRKKGGINNKECSSGNTINKKNKEKDKYSKSVNKDIIKGISKIQNILGKNNNNIIESKSNEESKIDTIENDFRYNEEQKQKVRTYIPRKKNNLNFTNDQSEIKINLEQKKMNEEIKNNINYKKDEQILNKEEKKVNSNNNTPMKYNEDMIQDEHSISHSDDDIIKNNNNDNKNNSNKTDKNGSSHNNSNESEEFDNYLKIIKKNKFNNILKGDITFLLNIISVDNYSIVLNQLIQLILYKMSKSKDKNTIINKSLKNNEDIIYNEHLFINLIFNQITKGIKYVCIYSKLCSDLNENIINDLSEQKNIKNNKERNLKLIINDECIKYLNNFKQEEIIILNDKENNDIYFFKKKIIYFVNFIYELINVEILKQQFGLFVIEQLDKLYNKDNAQNKFYDSIKFIYLEGIIELSNKLGKLFYEKDNQKLSQNINNYIQNNLAVLIDNKNQNNIPSNLKYKIMNLISKKEKQWKDTLYEIYEEEEKIKIYPEIKFNLKNNIIENELNKINKPNEQNINEINKALIEEDMINYINYFTEENNKGKINIKTEVDKSYNWKVIDELVNNKNFGLESLIEYFISICSSFIFDDNKLFLCNDYIKNIIEFYSNNLPKKSIESLQNEMIKTFSNIDNIVEQNNEMYKILGNLLFVLIDNKLFHIKFFNHYLKVDKKTQINLAIITKYCIISSGKFTKKYLNDFKQTKLFINSEIFEKYVIENMKDLLYYIK